MLNENSIQYVKDTFPEYLGKKDHVSASDLKTFMKKSRKGFEVANTLYAVRSMRPITEVFDKYNTFVNDDIYSQIHEYVELYSRLKDIDTEMYELNMKTLLSTVLQYINKNLDKYVKIFL
jgi:hypothetical protein